MKRKRKKLGHVSLKKPDQYKIWTSINSGHFILAISSSDAGKPDAGFILDRETVESVLLDMVSYLMNEEKNDIEKITKGIIKLLNEHRREEFIDYGSNDSN